MFFYSAYCFQAKKFFQIGQSGWLKEEKFFKTLLLIGGVIKTFSKRSRRFAEVKEFFQSTPASSLSIKNFFNTVPLCDWSFRNFSKSSRRLAKANELIRKTVFNSFFIFRIVGKKILTALFPYINF